jgi:ABC-type sugar transport system substrate-binding protein
MTSRLAKTLLATAAVAAMAIPAGAQAKQGADDPAGHVRHAPHTTVVTTPTATAQKKAAKKAAKKASSKSRTRNRHRHGRRNGVRRAEDNSARRQGRGADDLVVEVRGGGQDDGPNHK